MTSQASTCATKKTYDDISLQKRQKLIRLINQQKWTIRAAAQELSIKLCTAKHILYLYRHTGKIYRKRGELPPGFHSSTLPEVTPKAQNIQEIQYIPFPSFYFPMGQFPSLISLGDQSGNE